MIAARTAARRTGYSLLEVLVVVAALVILGALALPTISGMRGDTRSKAGADMIRGRMNEARAKAMEDKVAYRLAVSSDFKRVRLAPDTYTANGAAPTSEDGGPGPLVREDSLPEQVTASVVLTDEEQSMQDTEGWVRVATFLPDGTCREDSVDVEIREPGVTPFVVKLRGLTGAVSVVRGLVGGVR